MWLTEQMFWQSKDQTMEEGEKKKKRMAFIIKIITGVNEKKVPKIKTLPSEMQTNTHECVIQPWPRYFTGRRGTRLNAFQPRTGSRCFFSDGPEPSAVARYNETSPDVFQPCDETPQSRSELPPNTFKHNTRVKRVSLTHTFFRLKLLRAERLTPFFQKQTQIKIHLSTWQKKPL